MSQPLHSRTEFTSPPQWPDALQVPDVRVDGRAKVTGAARYTADATPEGTLFAHAVTSPLPHARILSVDTGRARALPGVHAVLTGADVHPARLGRRLQDQPVLAWDRVRFAGERVAAVAAETPEIARAAAALVDVRYEELPAVLDPADALAPDAAVLHEDAEQYAYIGGQRPPVGHPNLQSHRLVERGDVAAAFAGAAHVFTHTFTTPRQHHGAIETHAALVEVDAAGRVRVRSTNKAPVSLRRQLSVSTGVPVERIEVEGGFIGGDFGGKGYSIDEFLCYHLARATGRPVKALTTYADDLRRFNTRHPSVMRLRTAVSADGRFLGHEAEVLLDGGAYAAAKGNARLVPGGALGALAPYRIEHARIEVRVAYTNTVPSGNVRSPGQVQAVFAGESHVDMIAAALGLDPLELRARNVVRSAGDTGPAGQRYADPRAAEVLRVLGEVSGGEVTGSGGELTGSGDPPAARGRGMALSGHGVGGGRRAQVDLRLRADGAVEAVTALADQGGGAGTALQRVVALTLSVAPERVVVVDGTTATAPAGPDVGGSRVTHLLTRAAHAGATEMKERLEHLAAAELGWPEGGATLRDGAFARGGNPGGDAGGDPPGGGPPVPLEQLAASLLRHGPVEVEGIWDGAPEGGPAEHDFGACLVEVDVDRDTGAVTVRDAVLVVDVGTIINPLGHRGQLEGGFVFGLGAALTEELVVRDGTVAVGGLEDYRLPRSTDVPALRTVLIPSDTGPGAFGAKAVGELVNAMVAPAVANAVAQAVGARVTSLPLTPGRVLQALAAATPPASG